MIGTPERSYVVEQIRYKQGCHNQLGCETGMDLATH